MTPISRRLILILATMAPSSAAAQTVELRVIEDSSRRPLAGVVVRLVREGQPVIMGLSNPAGRVVLRAPSGGSYELRANRIGYEGMTPFRLVLEAGATVAQLVVMPRTVRRLPELTVTGDTRCRRSPGSGSLAAAIWEEVQTALSANRITAEQGLEIVHSIRYERDLSPTREMLRERLLGSGVTRGQPFVSLPPRQLARSGFVYQVADTVQYAAPDAALLLADEFVSSHCFKVDPQGPAAGLVGLAFEPAGTSRLPDVKGTLWIDRQSRELRYLEYTYTGLRGPEGLGDPGGEIHFQRLASGAWIVREWFIRMPRAAERRPRPTVGGDRWQLVGWLEQGGRASRNAPPGLPGGGARSAVQGVAFDRLHQTALAGALVTVDGEPDSTRTDSSGAFRLEIAGQGPRLLRVSHPLLGLVADSSTQEIRLAPGRAATPRIDVPPVGRFVQTFCHEQKGSSGVIGMARDSSGTPLSGARIRAAWFRSLDEYLLRGRVVTRALTVESDPRGVFAFCDLPGDWGVRLELLGEGDRALGYVTFRVIAGEFSWQDLRPLPALGR